MTISQLQRQHLQQSANYTLYLGFGSHGPEYRVLGYSTVFSSFCLLHQRYLIKCDSTSKTNHNITLSLACVYQCETIDSSNY